MTRRCTPADQQRLAQVLKQEAMRHSPAYSEMLHARIMQRIDNADSSAQLQPARLAPWRWSPLAAAAVILLALGIWGMRPSHRGSDDPAVSPGMARNTPPTLPAVDELWKKTAAPTWGKLEAELKDGRLAYLDQDARRLAHFVLDSTTPLPVGR